LPDVSRGGIISARHITGLDGVSDTVDPTGMDTLILSDDIKELSGV
jgi:hypothetical protein